MGKERDHDEGKGRQATMEEEDGGKDEEGKRKER